MTESSSLVRPSTGRSRSFVRFFSIGLLLFLLSCPSHHGLIHSRVDGPRLSRPSRRPHVTPPTVYGGRGGRLGRPPRHGGRRRAGTPRGGPGRPGVDRPGVVPRLVTRPIKDGPTTTGATRASRGRGGRVGVGVPRPSVLPRRRNERTIRICRPNPPKVTPRLIPGATVTASVPTTARLTRSVTAGVDSRSGVTGARRAPTTSMS